MLERLVSHLLKAAEAEASTGSCNDMPLAILQQLISIVDEEILPHVTPIVERLVQRLHEQIDEDEDISASSALELFAVIADSLSTIEADEADEEEEEEEDEQEAADTTMDEVAAADGCISVTLTPMQETAEWMCSKVRLRLQTGTTICACPSRPVSRWPTC